ncbi:hypothetical protein HYT23_03545 [Candidatus Pacearchaeota archaeon]|nr:hypothetical protein [Candidatus Pacearchaeota archaeon]
MPDISKKLLEKIIKQGYCNRLFSRYEVHHAAQGNVDFIERKNKILRTYSYYSIDGRKVL